MPGLWETIPLRRYSMEDKLFVLGLAIFYILLFAWGFRALPEEGWQILAVLPGRKTEERNWTGMNLTFYGFFTASAYSIGTAVMFVLLGSAGIPVWAVIMVAFFIAVLCVPASRWVAGVVERKPHTATVGGASFVGIVLAPWGIWLFSTLAGRGAGVSMEVMNTLAALSIAYSLGEGTGRLACISFGCCYGKPLPECHPLVQRLFRKRHFVFSGKTKKIAYAGGMDGVPVVPVQAVTSVIYVTSALAGVCLFLAGRPAAAYLETVIVTQAWRLASEFLRADYRGDGRISAYQWMGLFSIFYAVFIAFLFADASHVAATDVTAGLTALWDPVVFIFLQLTWLAMFLFTGRSMVTGSKVSFHVIEERI